MGWTAYLSLGCIAVIVLGLLWFNTLRPMLESFGVLRPTDDVNTYVGSGSAPSHSYVTQETKKPTDRAADLSLSAGLSVRSAEVPRPLRAIMLDSEATKEERAAATSRMSLVQALVSAGWKTSEIRKQLQGDNGTIGEQVQVARTALGLADEEAPRTRIAGREYDPNAYMEPMSRQAPAPAEEVSA